MASSITVIQLGDYIIEMQSSPLILDGPSLTRVLLAILYLVGLCGGWFVYLCSVI